MLCAGRQLPLLAVTGSFLHQNGQDPVFLMGYLYVVIIYSVLFTWVYNTTHAACWPSSCCISPSI